MIFSYEKKDEKHHTLEIAPERSSTENIHINFLKVEIYEQPQHVKSGVQYNSIFEKDIQQFLRIQSGPEGVHTLSFELLHTKSCQLYQKWRGSAICTIDEIAPQQKQYPITAGTYCLMITLDAPYPKNLQLSFVLQSSAEELVMVEDIHSKEPVPVHSLPVNPSSKVSLEKSPLKPSSAAPADSSTEAQLQELTLLNESLEQLQQLVGALEERSLRVSQDQEMIQQKVETLLQSLGDHTNT